jgi:hypothetical protein
MIYTVQIELFDGDGEALVMGTPISWNGPLPCVDDFVHFRGAYTGRVNTITHHVGNYNYAGFVELSIDLVPPHSVKDFVEKEQSE